MNCVAPVYEEALAKFRESREFLGWRGATIYNAAVGGVVEEFERLGPNDALKLSEAEKCRRYMQNIGASMTCDAVDPKEALKEDPLLFADASLPEGVHRFKVRSS